jgi:hypothetical protein
MKSLSHKNSNSTYDINEMVHRTLPRNVRKEISSLLLNQVAVISDQEMHLGCTSTNQASLLAFLPLKSPLSFPHSWELSHSPQLQLICGCDTELAAATPDLVLDFNNTQSGNRPDAAGSPMEGNSKKRKAMPQCWPSLNSLCRTSAIATNDELLASTVATWARDEVIQRVIKTSIM